MKHNWEYKRLGDVCFPKKEIGRANTYYGKDDIISYFDISSIDNNINRVTSYSSTTFGYAPSRAQQVIENGDILYSLVRPNLKNIALLNSDAANKVGTSGFCVLRGRSVLPKYILHFVLSSHFTEYILKRASGASYPAVTEDDVRKATIPVPPIDVQKHIVAELDELNGVIDAKREQLKQLDILAQSIYIQIFGDWADLEPLSYYVSQLTGGKSLASLEPCLNKVLKSGAVTYDYFDGSSTKYLPQDYMPLENHKVRVGDVIISRMNTAELVGACAYVFNVEDNIYLPDRLWRIDYKPNANPIFLWKSLISETSKKQIRAKASGTSGSMKNISKPLLLSVQIPKVPLSLQQQFAAKVEAIEEQKADIEASIKELQTLLDSRMDYWFN